MTSLRRFRACTLASIPCLLATSLWADIRLPAIFGDHMVLQREAAVTIWGSADPGEAVTVEAGSDKGSATAGTDGKWQVKLTKLTASDKPISLTFKGKNTIVLQDVLVGDVWVCSGQSNMEFGIKAFLTKDELAQAGNPQIRLFSVPKYVAPAPASDIAPAPANCPALGKWQVCTPETLAASGEWSGFPAVGYYFGREIQAFTHQPVGLIGTCWGGTRINSWTSLAGMEAVPAMSSYAKGAATFRDTYDKIKDTYEKETLPKWKAEEAKWQEDNKAATEQYQAEMKAWPQLARDAVAQGKPAPPKPTGPKAPKAPRDPIHDNQTSAALFNGMVAPLVPYAIKGVIWYQGESNGDQPNFYRIALPALIADWRKQWGQGDFPFLFVQLPNFMARKPEPSESNWAGIREAQLKALALPNTGLAVTIDLGDVSNIHPPDKQDVGHRLALTAQNIAYGEKIAVTSGPIYRSMSLDGNKVRLLFDHIGGGLTIGTAPEHFFVASKQPVTPPSTELKGFAIAGADNKFVWARAVIEGDAIVVSSEAVPTPVAVRYAWADNPLCNLYNKEGLPASPFRTDNLKIGE